MSYPASLYPRKLRHFAIPEKEPGPYLVTWCDGTMVQAFDSEPMALSYINFNLRLVRGVTDAKLTGPDQEYIACDCGCGRVMRDGDGGRIGTQVFHDICYAKHPVICGETMAAIYADEGVK